MFKFLLEIEKAVLNLQPMLSLFLSESSEWCHSEQSWCRSFSAIKEDNWTEEWHQLCRTYTGKDFSRKRSRCSTTWENESIFWQALQYKLILSNVDN